MSDERKVTFEPFKKNGVIKLNDKVRISDPCYDPDTWCAGEVENVLPGLWDCLYEDYSSEDPKWGRDQRIAGVMIRHQDYPDAVADELLDATFGVDSGQCGFFDAKYYRDQYKTEEKQETFYEEACGLTGQETVIDNPKYVPFHESSFFKEKYRKFLTLDPLSLKETFKLKIGKQLCARLMVEAKKEDEKKEIEKDFYECLDDHFKYAESEESKERLYCFKNTAQPLKDKGYVASSGFGDGCYPAYVGRNEEGKIVVMELSFISDMEEELEENLEEEKE